MHLERKKNAGSNKTNVEVSALEIRDE